MHAIQIIKSEKLFVIIETMFNISHSGRIEKIENLDHALRCNALLHKSNCVQLVTIRTNNTELRRIANKEKLS